MGGVDTGVGGYGVNGSNADNDRRGERIRERNIHDSEIHHIYYLYFGMYAYGTSRVTGGGACCATTSSTASTPTTTATSSTSTMTRDTATQTATTHGTVPSTTSKRYNGA